MHCSLVFQLIHRRFVPWSSVRCFLPQQMDKHRWKSKFIREREKWLLTIRCLDNFNWWVTGLLSEFFLQYSWNDACLRLWVVFEFLLPGKMHLCTKMSQLDDPGHPRCVRFCELVLLLEWQDWLRRQDWSQLMILNKIISKVWNKRKHQFLNVNLIKPSSTGLMTKWVTIWKYPCLLYTSPSPRDA